MYRYFPVLMSLGITVFLTPVFIKIARKLNICDNGNEDRKIHNGNIPLLGGLAIYIAFVISTLIFIDINQQFISLLIVSVIMIAVGILDDVQDLSAAIKFPIQAICSILIASLGYRIDFGRHFLDGDVSILLFDIGLTTLWLVGIMNAMNLIDGVDGLASGIAAISCIGFAIIGFISSNMTIVILSLALLGSTGGFLIYNRNPARIFMGDTGSLFLGCILGVLSIMSINMEINTASLFVPIILLTVPIFDTGWAMLRRLISRKDIFSADKGHIHHRLMDKGFNQRKTVYIMYVIQAIAVGIGVGIYISKLFWAGLSVIISLIILGIILSLSVARKGQSHIKGSPLIGKSNKQI